MDGLLASISHFVGLSARLPARRVGPHPVSSVMHRIPGTHGTLAQIFYPTDNGVNIPTSDHRPYVRQGVISGIANFIGIAPSVTTRVFSMLLGGVRSHVPDGRALHQVDAKQPLPVLYYMHGLGGNADIYSVVCADIASFNYVVVAIESEDGSGSVPGIPYQRPPKGMSYTKSEVETFRAPFLAKRLEEVKTALAYTEACRGDPHSPLLAARVLSQTDTTRVCIGGHSFGGAATVFVADALPSVFCAALLHDVWSMPIPSSVLTKGASLPVLSLLSEPFALGKEVALTKEYLTNSGHNVVGSYYVSGTVHSSFSDAPFWFPFTWLSKLTHQQGKDDPRQVMSDIVRLSVAFLDGAPAGPRAGTASSGREEHTRGVRSVANGLVRCKTV